MTFPHAIVISESSPFGVRANGVHTAFREQVSALRRAGFSVGVNRPDRSHQAALTTIHSAWPLAFAVTKSITRKTDVAIHAHITPDTLVGSFRFERSWSRLVPAYLRQLYSLGRWLIAPSHCVKADLVEELGIPSSRIHVVPCGIDVKRFATRPDSFRLQCLGRPHSRYRRTVLGVGQLVPRKGIDTFLAVARQLPRYSFVWVGGRPFGNLTAFPALFQRALERAPENVCFPGIVSDSDLRAYYHLADAFLLPSRQENFGQVVVEAGAAGLPLVLTDLPAFREYFSRGAMLSAEDDLAIELETVLETPVLYEGASADARALASSFDSGRTLNAFLDVVGVRVPSLSRQPSESVGEAACT